MKAALRGAGAVIAALLVALPLAAAELGERERLEDFDAMWRAVDTGYAFFDAGRAAWRQARADWRPRAARAKSREEFAAALAGALDTLRDDAVVLVADGHPAVRLPYDIDVWPRWEAGAARVEAVRVFSDADVAGVRPGQSLTQAGDVAVQRAVRERLGRAPRDATEAEWALRRILAERNHRPPRPPASPALSAHRIGEQRDLGYLRIRIGVPEPRFEEKLDAALGELAGTRAIIVDLRDNAGPGSREMTRALLARFARAETPWQLRGAASDKRTADVVSPAPMAYTAPVVVLVDRWTAGEGEALAAGLVAVAHAEVIGTRTAGLRSESREVPLPHGGFAVAFPAERAFRPDGTPRRELVPDIAIDLAAPKGGPGDPILYQALKRLASSAPARRTAPR